MMRCVALNLVAPSITIMNFNFCFRAIIVHSPMSTKTVDQALGGELIAAGGTFPEDEPPSFTASHAEQRSW